jgi:HEAT repeat protein
VNAVIAVVAGLAGLSAAEEAEGLRPRWGHTIDEWIGIAGDSGGDRDAAMRAKAVDALAAVWAERFGVIHRDPPEPPGLDAVAGAVGDPSAEVRRSAVAALGSVRDWRNPWAGRTAAALIAHFPRGEGPRRSAAAALIGLLETVRPPAGGLLLNDSRDESALRSVGEAVADALRRALASGDPAVREGAVRVLGGCDLRYVFGPVFPLADAESLLADAAGDPDPSVRRWAVWGLAGCSKGIHPRVAAVARSDPDPAVRRWAKATLLVRRGPDDERPELPADDLLDALLCECPALRAAAVAVAARRWAEDPRLPAAVAERMRRDRDPRVRRAAVPSSEARPVPPEFETALAEAVATEPDRGVRLRMIASLAGSALPHVAAAALLGRLSAESDERLRLAAAESLAELVERWPGVLPPAVAATAEAMRTDPVTAMLADLSDDDCRGAGRLLVNWSRAGTTVATRLRDGALHYVARPAHIPRLTAAMRDPLRDMPARLCVARFLLDLGSAEARDFVEHVIIAGPDRDRANALSALLAHVGLDASREWGVALLVRQLRNEDFLRGPADPPAGRRIISPFPDDPDFGDSSAEPDDDHSANGLAEVCRALGRLRCRAAVPGLVALLDRGAWVGPAAEALGRIGVRDPAVLDALRRRHSREPSQESEEALARLGWEPAIRGLEKRLPERPREDAGVFPREHGAEETLRLLGLVGDTATRPAVRRFTDSADPVEAATARASLVQLGVDDPVAALLESLSGTCAAEEVAALARALAGRGDPRAVGPLEATVRTATGYEETIRCLEAIRDIGGPEAAAALERLRRADYTGRREHPGHIVGKFWRCVLSRRFEDRLPEAVDGALELLRGRAAGTEESRP